MYCPLCKAEYRAGFGRCSDCLTGLVHTREEAEATNVVMLWQGTSQARFKSIVWALRNANIPNRAESGAQSPTKRPFWAYIGIIWYFYTQFKEMHEAMSWKISVLESDYLKAQAIVETNLEG